MPESNNKGGRKPRVTDAEILAVFQESSDPVLSTAEVAEQVPIKRRGVLSRLRTLEEEGVLESKQIGGRNTVWWDYPTRDELAEALGKRRREEIGDELAEAVKDQREAWNETESGRRSEASEEVRDTPPETPESDAVTDALEDVDFPAGREREACSAAVYAARDYLREHGPATMREIVAEVLPEHPLGYDVDGALEKVEAGERYRGAWWRRVVKPGLKALPDVEAPARGASEWRYTGEA